jgi:phage shock protein PspC (stress-responsive transcriptional regulator)
MTDTTATTADPGPSPIDSERRLVRPTDGRKVAGVAAGLARYFGISPIVYRVAFAALTLLGGSGIILYLTAWLVIPDERRRESVVEEAIRGRRERPWLALGVVLVGVGLILGISGGHLWPNALHGWLTALVVGLALIGWQLREPSTPAPSGPETSGAAGVAPTPAVGAATPRRRFPLFAVTLGAVFAGLGVLGVLDATGTVDVDWTLALAGGVLLVGIAIAVAAFVGGVGPLAVLGTFLAAILLAVATIDIPLHGQVGGRVEHPANVLQLRDTYRQAVGSLELRLQDVQLPQGRTTVTASVGVGKLEIRVPQDVRVEVTSHVTGGESDLFGATESGWNVDHAVTFPEGGAAGDLSRNPRTLVLKTTVGFGRIEVDRG